MRCSEPALRRLLLGLCSVYLTLLSAYAVRQLQEPQLLAPPHRLGVRHQIEEEGWLIESRLRPLELLLLERFPQLRESKSWAAHADALAEQEVNYDIALKALYTLGAVPVSGLGQGVHPRLIWRPENKSGPPLLLIQPFQKQWILFDPLRGLLRVKLDSRWAEVPAIELSAVKEHPW